MKFFISKFFILLILCFTCVISLFAMTLGEGFNQAEKGDFIVLALDKHVTLFHILEKSTDRLVIEEITAQERNTRNIASWQTWVSEDAPHHTGWTISTFQLPTYRHLSTYSYDTRELLKPDSEISFLPALFMLPMEKVPQEGRKLIGAPPMPGEIDRRKVWNPRIIFLGKEQALPTFVYTIIVPKDLMDIGGKKLDLYFPTGKESLCYFPYWIEVRGGIAKVKLRAIDSGRNLTSPASATLHK